MQNFSPVPINLNSSIPVVHEQNSDIEKSPIEHQPVRPKLRKSRSSVLDKETDENLKRTGTLNKSAKTEQRDNSEGDEKKPANLSP
jgi:hypothetical protein